MSWRTTVKMLGPGLLFAGAAIGVSHLVQSTRAGADYGFGLIWAVLLIHFVKYPFFEFGPRYAAVKKETLIHGYKKLGPWMLGIFVLMTLGTMFAIQGAVTSVTAALVVNMFGGTMLQWTMALLGVCALILWFGKYSLLDNVMKVVILTLTISTILAVGFALSKGGNEALNMQQVSPFSEGMSIGFLIALMGWLPAPMDLSVWHSIWALEKQDATTEDFNLQRSIFDFKIGYFGTIFLAIAFLLLGGLVMYGSGESFSPAGAVFAKQLIDLYTSSLGEGARLFIMIAAFTAMFSTTLTVLDAIPRTAGKATQILLNKEGQNTKRYYWIWMAILIIGTLIILAFLISSMGQMVKIATVLSFLTAPFFAYANYRLVTAEDFPQDARPSKTLIYMSWFGMLFLVVFSVIYVVNM